MVWLLKSSYERHAEKLHGKLFRIVSVLDSSELRHLCLNVIRKVPSNGLKLFDSDYNLIKKFSYPIRRDDYLLFFSHHHTLGKVSDLKLARYLTKMDLFDENDPDYTFVKEHDADTQADDFEIISEDTPRKGFPKEVRDRILKLQRYHCAVPRCKLSPKNWKYLEFDHIKGRDDNSITNCQALCPFHHRAKTRGERIKRNIKNEMANGRKKTPRESTRISGVRRTRRHYRRRF